jgi:hypothetical protein
LLIFLSITVVTVFITGLVLLMRNEAEATKRHETETSRLFMIPKSQRPRPRVYAAKPRGTRN